MSAFDEIPDGFRKIEDFLADQFSQLSEEEVSQARAEVSAERVARTGVLTLADLRLRKGLSQKALAAAIGGVQPRLSLWESGKERPSYEYILKLSHALEVDYNILFEALQHA